MAYIYKIENNINHKVYIGKTEHLNPLKRWGKHKAVAKLDKETGEILEIYPSVIEAGRQNNGNTHIKDVCHGKRKSTGGFGWKFLEKED